MRGRTLNHSFIILDEAQNTTPEQMKMFLTRIGFGTKAVITGDVTQIDLARGQKSGLIEAERVLTGVRGIAFVRFTSADVVRHPLVQKIIDAYERDDEQVSARRRPRSRRQCARDAPPAPALRWRSACSCAVDAGAACRAPRRCAAGRARALERDATVTLRFVDGARRARAQPRATAARDYATNVLTFVYDDGVSLAGDIVLCAPVRRAARRARSARRLPRTARIWSIHGMLHLQGYDHERDDDARAHGGARDRAAARPRLRAIPYAGASHPRPHAR